MALAVDAGLQADLDVGDARAVRRKASIHVKLPRAGVMARVEEPERSAVAGRQVQAARIWASRCAPVVPLVRPELQPFVSSDGAVTLWQYLHAGNPVDNEELGRATRRLHDTTRGMSFSGLLRHDPFADTCRWIDRATEWLADEDRIALQERFEVLKERWHRESANDPLGMVVIHGDLHGDNALATGRDLLLVDLEDAGVGPASYDLVPLAVGVSRYGTDEAELQRFLLGYGDDPREWPGFKTMCDVYELYITSWAIHCSGMSAAMAAEAAVRVDGVLGRSNMPWTMM